MAKLMHPAEAVTLFEHAKWHEYEDSRQIAARFERSCALEGRIATTDMKVLCAFHAGRVLGIREERAWKHKLPDSKLAPCPDCGGRVHFTREAALGHWRVRIDCPKCGLIKAMGDFYGTPPGLLGANISYAGEDAAVEQLLAQWNGVK